MITNTDDDKWVTHDGYEYEKELNKNDIKEFFDGGRKKRNRDTENDTTGSTNKDDVDRVRHIDGKNKPVSKSTKKGATTSKNKA